MTATEKALTERIKDLEASAQKARLEAMHLAARLLARETSQVARSNADQSGEVAALRARYDMLVRVADDAQAQIDKLLAEQHDVKYYR
jgi:soluble cytochrome b562